MLVTKTYLDRSSIHGIGLFAATALIKGQLVWEHNPEVDLCFSADKWQSLMQELHQNSFDIINGLHSKSGNSHYLSIDNGQFINHSNDRPNIGFKDSAFVKMVALEDIGANTELTCDYRQYSDADCPVYLGTLKSAD